MPSPISFKKHCVLLELSNEDPSKLEGIINSEICLNLPEELSLAGVVEELLVYGQEMT